MWRYVNNPIISSSNNFFFVDCNYQIFSGLTDDIISPSGTVTISNIIRRVRELFTSQIERYNFPDPSSDEIYILNVHQIVDGIRIMDQGRIRSEYNCPAMVDPLTNRIVIPNPTKQMTPCQVLSHEVGHWFFDKIVDDIVKENNPRHNREDLLSFSYYTELAAIYCQEEICGRVRNRQDYENHVQRMFEEIDFFRDTSEETLYLILLKLFQTDSEETWI
jgi:hypothetical protein